MKRPKSKPQPKKELLILKGKVTESLPGTEFLVTLESSTDPTKELFSDKVIQCYLSGKMHLNKIRVLVGDTVEIEMSITDLLRGRIVRRFR